MPHLMVRSVKLNTFWYGSFLQGNEAEMSGFYSADVKRKLFDISRVKSSLSLHTEACFSGTGVTLTKVVKLLAH